MMTLQYSRALRCTSCDIESGDRSFCAVHLQRLLLSLGHAVTSSLVEIFRSTFRTTTPQHSGMAHSPEHNLDVSRLLIQKLWGLHVHRFAAKFNFTENRGCSFLFPVQLSRPDVLPLAFSPRSTSDLSDS
jgi:hypothetical protein